MATEPSKVARSCDELCIFRLTCVGESGNFLVQLGNYGAVGIMRRRMEPAITPVIILYDFNYSSQFSTLMSTVIGSQIRRPLRKYNNAETQWNSLANN